MPLGRESFDSVASSAERSARVELEVGGEVELVENALPPRRPDGGATGNVTQCRVDHLDEAGGRRAVAEVEQRIDDARPVDELTVDQTHGPLENFVELQVGTHDK